MKEPKQKLEDFTHEELLRFAQTSQAQNIHLSREREELLKKLETRKPIGISSTVTEAGDTYDNVICNDGTMWYGANGSSWNQFAPIPQPKDE